MMRLSGLESFDVTGTVVTLALTLAALMVGLAGL